MDHKQSLDYRYVGYQDCNTFGRKKYDYGKNGILTKVLPRILFRSSPKLVAFLQLIDMQLISMFKSIQSVERFKHITSY